MESVNIDPAALYKLVVTVGIFSAVIAAAVTGIIHLIGGWRERLATEKRHLRDLALQTAVEKYQIEKQRAEEMRLSGKKWTPPVFDAYVIHTMRLVEIAKETSLSTDEVIAKLIDLRNFSRSVEGTMRGRHPERNDEQDASQPPPPN